MTAKIALESDEETHWIAMLMASGSKIRAAKRRRQKSHKPKPKK
jgi:hypothetical protein